ncbi:glycosyltransferase family 8 protein [Aplosporella prunicola CBS 121167]|uniref:Glycosyltransferase family 8 protein n=1 Tax=Aplosporella prunicola CBS 121167 TaxID=1176127 RepID=A0A6A6BGY9_9PEZI|nr:glycosyltransferase family 8 protein [Aplosporella prunicola CBS 121167]KAF2142868.1 glycosyltransferase family 8 protein [Aplosporella prunicola CBS 121167]
MARQKQSCAYTTLITRSSYLAGVILLAYTLKKLGSAYPLVVFYTDNVPAASLAALRAEAPHSNLILARTSALVPRANVKVHLIAERFGDTWTKLRVFEHEALRRYERVCYLDADMMICNRNMDEIFDVRLRGDDWLAANHACVCNRDKDPWAPANWTTENCAFTPVSHPMAEPTPVTPDSRPTYHLLNSGMFLFAPSQQLWDRMLELFNTTSKLAEFKFPDQDFLAEFFRGRWQSVGWQYNALKTMRYWHPDMWHDDEVVCLHYIVDKPWAARIGPDGTAGYLGRDGETHRWWWNEYAAWQAERNEQGERQLLETVANRVQAFAKNKPPEVKKSEEQLAY